MNPLPLTFICLSVLSQFVLSLSPIYISCQLKKPAGSSPLEGCPEGTLYVSSTDASANFSAVQEAIDSLPETGTALILIGEGQYYEMLNVTRREPLTLLGQLDPATAWVRGVNASERNIVHIWNNFYVGKDCKATDEETATLTVGPSCGHSFGNPDFRVYNIDFENRAANYPVTPALVTSITLANASFYGCTFASRQDTWFTGNEASTYVIDSIIYGQTDYIFGLGTAWFRSVILANRGCGGGMTAWKGKPGSTRGVYITNSKIIRSPDADPATVTVGQCYLGRPWNEYAVAVFLHNYMDNSINPAGFSPWPENITVPITTYYAEYGSYGPGGNHRDRISQDHILDPGQAETYALHRVFQETPGWIDFEYHHH